MDWESVSKALEFDRVRDIWASLCASPLGHERIMAQMPLAETEQILRISRRTTEMAELLREPSGGFPIWGLHDIREELKRATIEGAALEGEALLKIAESLSVAKSVRDFLTKRKEKYPLLFGIAQGLSTFSDIESAIGRAIDGTGEVRNDATAELKQIRQAMAKENEHLHERLDTILQDWTAKGLVQEAVIAMKAGRLVIPVKEGARHRVRALIVDQSASGATVFLEPTETLEISNRVRQLEIEEKKEVHRILRALTGLIHERLADIWLTLEILSEMDEIYARGRLSVRWDCVAPSMNLKGELKIIQGRHPLLWERIHDAVVRLDLEIASPTRTLVISGPNAGGKTVTLKTVGLFCLMAAMGLHVPAAPGTELAHFESVFADIGDAQSIESDLSTFTAHIMKLKEIVTQASHRKLVLIDEIGSSTDPALGAALGEAVLEELTNEGATTLCTTHQGALKAFAHGRPGFQNGSMAFDAATLKPTYQFRAGVPGSSYAIEIAERVGLPSQLLERARVLLGDERVGLEELVAELSQKIESYEKLRRRSDLKATEFEGLQKLYSDKLADLRRIEREHKKKAIARAEEIFERANTELERAVREIKEEQAKHEAIKAAHERIEEAKKEITREKAKVAGEEAILEEREGKPLEHEPKIGERVHVAGFDAPARVVAMQRGKGRVQVEIGSAKVWVGRQDLRSAGAEVPKSEAVHVKFELGERDVPYELDIRGQFAEDALLVVDQYLVDCYTRGWKSATIVHGKGTGALRTRVREFLSTHPLVKGYTDGGPNRADFGSTIVELAY
jgi:DNA mismatch repair protein MutS2